MQKKMLVLAAVAASSLFVACAKKEGATAEGATAAAGELTTDAQKFGYSIGVDLGKSLAPVKADVDVESLKAGLDDAVSGKTPKLDDKQREEVKMTVAKKLQEKQVAEREKQAGKAKTDGEKFLAENGKKAGVKTTASGLQYEVLTEGKGAHPKASDTVTVHYKGTLLNGEEFDSSYSRNQPVTFPLGNVIPGWTEGVQLMTPGSKYKFYIPSALGYGERGAGVKIGPNETLVFEVELLSVGEEKK
ncbi:FKBP-type peptidyl-prolyl cis-trans isomerase [Solimonas sp. K1W22B-7]|uniref:FKBP-type peptidyl-prolyl cis-trans isomerase n=1 Tax=Solimonas sp. K1W22B-7 TaxID=2303331 RepID=UPI000E330D7B|nr:FKBP-type peptidyl-prolyl cis-trans isomerase [Solimonas sp. K1W22B-7]AXQ31216.1 FKBP-type peptidyl-prolyl cis-trans isomerase [Solimonas sp. K1W22B-7]